MGCFIPLTLNLDVNRSKVNEQPKVIKTKSIEITDHGDEIAFPISKLIQKVAILR